jgi:hypothetical protein
LPEHEHRPRDDLWVDGDRRRRLAEEPFGLLGVTPAGSQQNGRKLIDLAEPSSTATACWL